MEKDDLLAIIEQAKKPLRIERPVRKKISWIITKELHEEFRDFCKRHGIKQARLMRDLMKAVIDTDS